MSAKNKVYYGEYSLRHWIDLMLQGNISLPQYQRSFVWEDKDIKRLISSLHNGQFVLPVTIAHYVNGNKSENLILDGQQRLTSLLLAMLGYFPDKTKFVSVEEIAKGDDSLEDGDNSLDSHKHIGWTFMDLLDKRNSLNSLDQVRERISKSDKYKRMDVALDGDFDDFWDNTFLGFSYVVPSAAMERSMTQHFYSTLFRNMNYLGTKLSPLESRRSLYYMGEGYNKFFEGLTKDSQDVLCGITLQEDLQSRKIDFVRYLSTLSQYVATAKNINKVLLGYSAFSSRESYFADYVSFIVGLEQENRIDKFEGFNPKTFFDGDVWCYRFDVIKEFLQWAKKDMDLDLKKNAFKGWIDADYWLFGLLYWALFEGKHIRLDDKLSNDILEKISQKKKDENYSKNPNRLGNLRGRILDSIALYQSYAE